MDFCAVGPVRALPAVDKRLDRLLGLGQPGTGFLL
jgi:hypothetical protein